MRKSLVRINNGSAKLDHSLDIDFTNGFKRVK